jgi:hypothetical protein
MRFPNCGIRLQTGFIVFQAQSQHFKRELATSLQNALCRWVSEIHGSLSVVHQIGFFVMHNSIIIFASYFHILQLSDGQAMLCTQYLRFKWREAGLVFPLRLNQVPHFLVMHFFTICFLVYIRTNNEAATI